MRFAIPFIVLFACAGFTRAEDIVTSDGKVFKNAEIVKFEAGGLVFKHDGGTNQIFWNDLPAVVRRRYQAEARAQKEAEIQKLKQDLARAEAEAARLSQQEEAAETRKLSPDERPADSAKRPFATAEPARPVAGSPPVKPYEMVDAADLVHQFKADATGANRRYHNRTFRVKGVIERFETKMFVRKYDVILESPDRFVRVIAVFDYPNDYKVVFPTQRGQTLVGKPTDNQEVTLMRSGQSVVLQGKCKGARDTEIVFTGCALIR